MIDIGANLTSTQFRTDLQAVIDRGWASGLSAIIVTGTTVQASQDALRITRDLGQGRLYSTAGVHPHYAQHYSNAAHEQLRALLRHAEVVACGEMGLDYDRNLSSPDLQRLAFEQQIELAAEVGKPLFLHQRSAHEDFLAILRAQWKKSALPGVVHCFTGTRVQAEAYLDLGLDIGITGWVCDPRRNADLLEALKAVPPDRLHIETDAPYLLPPTLSKSVGKDKRRNEPGFLGAVAAGLARAYGMPLKDLEAQCTKNSRRLFQIREN